MSQPVACPKTKPFFEELWLQSLFPTSKDNAAGEEIGNPNETPFATKIWRAYIETKKILPDQDRMKTLAQRVWDMSRLQFRQEEAVRYVLQIYHQESKFYLLVLIGCYSRIIKIT